MDLGKFFTPRYLFDTTVVPWQGFGEEVLYMCLGLVVIGIVLKIIVGVNKAPAVQLRLFAKLSNLSMTMGFIGLFFWLCRTQYIPIFNMRFWWIVWLVGFLVWLWFVVQNIKRFMANKEKSVTREDVYDKYLPKKKK